MARRKTLPGARKTPSKKEDPARRKRVRVLSTKVKALKNLVNCPDELEKHANKVARLLLNRCSGVDSGLLDEKITPDWVTDELVQRLWKNLSSAAGGEAALDETAGLDAAAGPDPAGEAPSAEGSPKHILQTGGVPAKKPKPIVKNKSVSGRRLNSRAFDIWWAEFLVKERAKSGQRKRLKWASPTARKKQRKQKWEEWQLKRPSVKVAYTARACLGGARMKDQTNRWRKILPSSHEGGPISAPQVATNAVAPRNAWMKPETMRKLLVNIFGGFRATFPGAHTQASMQVRTTLAKAFAETGLSKRTASLWMGTRVSPKLWVGSKSVQWKRAGRKKGSCRAPAGDLRMLIAKHTAPSCEVSLRWGDTVLNLTKSISRAWHTDEALQVYKKRTLQAKLQGGKLGVTKLKRRTDCCHFCIAWNSTISKGITSSLNMFLNEASALLPAYRDIWAALLRGNHPEWINDCGTAIEDPAYIEYMRRYIETQGATYPDMRRALNDDKRTRLEKIEGDIVEVMTRENGIEAVVELISWHWSLKDWMQERFWKEWYQPDQRTLYLLFDYKENGTLPQGPAATAAEWRANARLGYTVFGVCIWTQKWHRWVYYISRNMEHTTAATVAMLNDLWKDVVEQLANVDHIRTWSDGGTHFRSNPFLAYMGTTVTEKLRKDTSTAYGVVNHFKNPCDGEFGRFNDRVDEAACKEKMSETKGLVAGLRAVDPNPCHVYKDFFPPAKADITIERLKVSSMPCGVQASHYWEFHITRDTRRKGLEGRATDTGRPITGVTAKACMLPGIRKMKEATFEPVLESQLCLARRFSFFVSGGVPPSSRNFVQVGFWLSQRRAASFKD